MCIPELDISQLWSILARYPLQEDGTHLPEMLVLSANSLPNFLEMINDEKLNIFKLKQILISTNSGNFFEEEQIRNWNRDVVQEFQNKRQNLGQNLKIKVFVTREEISNLCHSFKLAERLSSFPTLILRDNIACTNFLNCTTRSSSNSNCVIAAPRYLQAVSAAVTGRTAKSLAHRDVKGVLDITQNGLLKAEPGVRGFASFDGEANLSSWGSSGEVPFLWLPELSFGNINPNYSSALAEASGFLYGTSRVSDGPGIILVVSVQASAAVEGNISMICQWLNECKDVVVLDKMLNMYELTARVGIKIEIGGMRIATNLCRSRSAFKRETEDLIAPKAETAAVTRALCSFTS